MMAHALALVTLVNCVLSSPAADASEAASAEAAIVLSDLASSIEDLSASGRADIGFARLQQLLRKTSPIANDDWRSVHLRCLVLVESGTEQGAAAGMLARTCLVFPEDAADCLTSILKGIESAEQRDKSLLLLAIRSVPIKSAEDGRRLRKELDTDAPFGAFVSIHAAVSIAHITHLADERMEMLHWLESRLDSEAAHVRWMCADGLGHFGKNSLFATEHLRRLLRDKSPAVRFAAARAIWRIVEDESTLVETLIDILQGEDAPYYSTPVSLLDCQSITHLLAMRTLGESRTEDPRVVELLCTQLSSTSFVHRSVAVSSLLQLPVRRPWSRDAIDCVTEMAKADESMTLRAKAKVLSEKLRVVKE